MKNTKTLVLTALFTALTCVATMIIRIPTITGGYVNLGDALVLLSGLILGPIYGTLAAAIGSALADLFAGYLVYAPATFIIKGLTALVGCLIFGMISKLLNKSASTGNSISKKIPALVIAGICGEAVMVIGYFVFEIFMIALSDGGTLSSTTLAAGITASAAGIPGNVVQGVFGVAISSILYPILSKQLIANA